MCELLSDADALDLLLEANLADDGLGFIKTAGHVAKVQGVSISINPLEPTEHRTGHFHARFNSDESASYSIATCEVLAGELDSSRHKAVKKWWSTRVDALRQEWTRAQSGQQPHKIAASLTEFIPSSVTYPTASKAYGNIGQVLMMEVDDFIEHICTIAKQQNLASDEDLKSISSYLGTRIYEIGKDLCDLHRRSEQGQISGNMKGQSAAE